MNWNQTELDLGEITEKERTVVYFTSPSSLDIATIIPSCNCSSPSYDKEGGTLSVVYVPTEVPPHLYEQGFYESEKTLRIRYEDGSHELLKFTSKVMKK